MGVKRKFQAVKDVMTEKIVYIDGMATAKEASELMKKEKVGVLIVKKRDEKDENGIVVIKDFINNVIIPDRTSSEVLSGIITLFPTELLKRLMFMK